MSWTCGDVPLTKLAKLRLLSINIKTIDTFTTVDDVTTLSVIDACAVIP